MFWGLDDGGVGGGEAAGDGLLVDEDGAVGGDFAEAAVEIVGDPDVAEGVEGEAVGVVAAIRVREELAAGIAGGGRGDMRDGVVGVGEPEAVSGVDGEEERLGGEVEGFAEVGE